MTRIALSALALATFTACVAPADGPGAYAELLPDARLMVSMPADLGGARAGQSQAYAQTAKVTRDVNAFIGTVVLTLDLVTDLPPTWSDTEANTAVWGPFADALAPAETVLWVTHEVDDGVYSWVVAQRPRHTEDDWTPIVAGQVGDDGTDADHEGWFAFDFDAAAAMDPTVTLTGRFVTDYDVNPDGVIADALFEDFSEDGSTPGDAAYHYDQDFGGNGLMDLAIRADLNPDSGTGLEEVLLMRSRWTALGSGRSDVLVTEGDLGSAVGTASECWDEQFTQVYYVDSGSWASPVGDPQACAFGTESFSDESAE